MQLFKFSLQEKMKNMPKWKFEVVVAHKANDWLVGYSFRLTFNKKHSHNLSFKVTVLTHSVQ